MVGGGGSADFNPSVPVKLFSAGAAGCVADLVTFPLDTAKVRLQIQGESEPLVRGQRATYRGVFGTMFTIVRTEGARGLYNGLLAGLHRQMSFASVRVGLYDATKQFYGRGSESKRKVVGLRRGDVVARVDSNGAVRRALLPQTFLDKLLYVNR